MIRRTLIAAAVAALATPALAGPVNFAATIDDADGRPFQECLEVENKVNPPVCKRVGDLTLGYVVRVALNLNEPNISVEQIFLRGQLSQKIAKAITPVDLTAEEVKVLKDQVVKTGFSPLEKFSAIGILDPATALQK